MMGGYPTPSKPAHAKKEGSDRFPVNKLQTFDAPRPSRRRCLVTDTSTSLSGWQLTGTASPRLWPRGVDFWTADTADTATTAWIKGLRVFSLSSVTPWTADKSVRASPCKCSPALPWCLVRNVTDICSAEKAPAPTA